MRSTAITLLVVTAGLSLALCSGPALALTETWTGTLTWDTTEAQFVARDGWENTSTSLTWTVTWYDFDEPSWAGWYLYEYEWSAQNKSSSHYIIEVSPEGDLPAFDEATWNDIADYSDLGGEDPAAKLYVTGGADQPNMPDDLYGIKFDSPGEPLTETVWFYSRRVPVWGDFYAKDGAEAGVVAEAWNAGFTKPDTDPTDPIASLVDGPNTAFPNGYYLNPDGSKTLWTHVAVPDSTYSTPEPGAWILLLSASAFSAFIRRRRA